MVGVLQRSLLPALPTEGKGHERLNEKPIFRLSQSSVRETTKDGFVGDPVSLLTVQHLRNRGAWTSTRLTTPVSSPTRQLF